MSLLSKEKIIEFQKHTGFEYLIKTRRACNESQRRTDSEQLSERKSIVREAHWCLHNPAHETPLFEKANRYVLLSTGHLILCSSQRGRVASCCDIHGLSQRPLLRNTPMPLATSVDPFGVGHLTTT